MSRNHETCTNPDCGCVAASEPRVGVVVPADGEGYAEYKRTLLEACTQYRAELDEARQLAEEYRDEAYEAQKLSCNEYRRFGKPVLPWESQRIAQTILEETLPESAETSTEITPYAAFGQDEIDDAPPIGNTIACWMCGKRHRVSTSTGKMQDGSEGRTRLHFFKCRGVSYMCGIDGKEMRPRGKK